MGDESLQEEALASPALRLCSDCTQHSGSGSPRCLLVQAWGVSAWSAGGCPFPVPPWAGGPYTETTFLWALFLFQGPQASLPSALTCLGGSRTDGSKLHSPQASPCPRLGALDVERGLSCLLTAGGGAGACLPCISSQMPGEPRPKVALGVLLSRRWPEAGPCISRLQTHGS